VRIGNDTEYEVIEPGTYPAQLVEWTDVDQFGKPLMSMGFGDREPCEQWRFKFHVDVEGEERHLSVWVNKPRDPNNVSPKAKIVELAKAILGDKAESDDWEIEDLVEGQLRVQVEVYEKKDGSEANKISKFYPPKPKRQPRAAADDDAEPAPAPREPVVAGGQRKTPF